MKSVSEKVSKFTANDFLYCFSEKNQEALGGMEEGGGRGGVGR